MATTQAVMEGGTEYVFPSSELYLKHIIFRGMDKENVYDSILRSERLVDGLSALAIPLEVHDTSTLEKRKKICALYKSMRDKANQTRQYHQTSLKQRLKQFASTIHKLAETPSSFIAMEEQVISSELAKIDTQIVEEISHLAVLLSHKLQLAQKRLLHGSNHCETLRKSLEISKRVMTFGSYLSFETHGRINVRQISRTPAQFARCKKAVIANIKPGVFSGTPYDGIDVVEAFKIENSVLLGDFDKQKKSLRGKSILKGLFSIIDEKQVLNLILYGVDKRFELSEVSQVPKTLKAKIYSDPGKKLAEMLEESNMGFGLPLYMSNYSVSEELKEILKSEDPPKLLVMALCRVIVPQEKSEGGEVFYSKLKDAYEIHNRRLVYPEYILLCKICGGTVQRKSRVGVMSSMDIIHEEIGKISQEEEDIKMNIKNFYEQFWGNINSQIQKQVHPKVIEECESVVEELKEVVEEKKRWIQSISAGSSELKLLLNQFVIILSNGDQGTILERIKLRILLRKLISNHFSINIKSVKYEFTANNQESTPISIQNEFIIIARPYNICKCSLQINFLQFSASLAISFSLLAILSSKSTLCSKSSLYFGITCKCTCRTDCPACSPSCIAYAIPFALWCVFSAFPSLLAVFHNSRISSTLSSWYLATDRKGHTNTCPGTTGLCCSFLLPVT
eukprot:TRINITY_DN5471_c0_g2_i1.p1 TRINITY_DN5471_c0_g2~~TRINITY_DN5471_c0_g2_i1.p1  ORF type:complete len:678 (-),score=55.06 TRINITY_DN5471_c0_g2_i1:147-2180(-)